MKHAGRQTGLRSAKLLRQGRVNANASPSGVSEQFVNGTSAQLSYSLYSAIHVGGRWLD